MVDRVDGLVVCLIWLLTTQQGSGTCWKAAELAAVAPSTVLDQVLWIVTQAAQAQLSGSADMAVGAVGDARLPVHGHMCHGTK